MGESMSGLRRTGYCGEITEAFTGSRVTVMGWVNKRRDLGRLIFITLRDREGIVQITVDGNTVSPELFKKAESIRSEYVVAASGIVRERSSENVNPDMKTGKVEIEADDIRILSEADTTPFQIGDASVGNDLRLKYRYLDLRRPDLQKSLIIRHKAAQAVRSFMDSEGFVEIETPMLTRSSPEGARDYLVPSRVNPGSFYALPQSPQMFKQILMVSGFDKYFQIVKCFRDEDLRADRQPEFTQIDIEMSFVDQEDVVQINERLLQKLFKEILDVNLQIPFARMPYAEAMNRFGSDKPDTRFGMELVDISHLTGGTEFGVFNAALENAGSVRGINAKNCGNYPRKQIDTLVEFVKTYGAKGLAWIVITEDGKAKTSLQKFFPDERLDEIVKEMKGEPGDLLLICADKNTVVYDALGALRVEIAKRQGLLDNNKYNFLWVTEFPLLEWDEEQNRFFAKHHPFTAPMDEDLALLETDPGAVRAKAYDIILNGTELGGGSIRIYQREIQERMFKALGFTMEEAYKGFGFLLEAFKYGAPPHGGLAYGFDRMIMLITSAESIRDVIAFPKVKDASCPMTSAPNTVDSTQLKELGLVQNINLIPEASK